MSVVPGLALSTPVPLTREAVIYSAGLRLRHASSGFSSQVVVTSHSTKHFTNTVCWTKTLSYRAWSPLVGPNGCAAVCGEDETTFHIVTFDRNGRVVADEKQRHEPGKGAYFEGFPQMVAMVADVAHGRFVVKLLEKNPRTPLYPNVEWREYRFATGTVSSRRLGSINDQGAADSQIVPIPGADVFAAITRNNGASPVKLAVEDPLGHIFATAELPVHRLPTERKELAILLDPGAESGRIVIRIPRKRIRAEFEAVKESSTSYRLKLVI